MPLIRNKSCKISAAWYCKFKLLDKCLVFAEQQRVYTVPRDY